MSDAIPAFGAERNVAIARLLGWTGLYLAQSPRTPGGAWGNDPADAPGLGGQRVACNFLRSAVPNYCGNNGDCFGLLVTLQLQTTPYNTEILRNQGLPCCTVAPARCSNTPFFFYDGYSELSGEAGWRDAITQAAWLALTAAKETKSPTAPAQPEPQAVTD